MGSHKHSGISSNSANETSGFIYNPEEIENAGISAFISDKFENIMPLYDSPTGPFRLYSANRYGKRYVLKCLKDNINIPPIYEAAFLKEFEIGMSVDHPNVRATIGMQNIEGLGKALILEYVDGDNLEEYLKKETVTKKKARAIFMQICSAMKYMHRKQIIHRDLKPSNIMVTHSGDIVKIIDFSLSDSDAFMIVKNPAGTPSYMAPEVYTEGYRIDRKADIWSLGKIAECLSIASGDLNLAEIASKCLKENPNDRPENVEKIIRILKTREKYHLDYFSLNSSFLTYTLILIILVLLLIILVLLSSRGLLLS